MKSVNAYAALRAKAPLQPHPITRRAAEAHDVEIDILYCGVCHSDVHQVRDEWGGAKFPMVPGHEIVGKVVGVGKEVKNFKIGDAVGVGCFVGSCRKCAACEAGTEQYCSAGMHATYNGHDQNGEATFGGYSEKIVVDENYVLRIPANLPLDQAAPLLCAGITTYSPLKHWQVKAGDQVAVAGLGGLGHMAVKIAAAMGAEVTVLSTSDAKKPDAMRLGARHFVNVKKAEELKKYLNHFSLLINTASGNTDLAQYLQLLAQDGTMVIVGAPENPSEIRTRDLIGKRRRIAGSLIGGIKETQEMLDFCGQHNLTADIELISIDEINRAYDRMVAGNVRYRFVIDLATLKDPK